MMNVANCPIVKKVENKHLNLCTKQDGKSVLCALVVSVVYMKQIANVVNLAIPDVVTVLKNQ